MQNIPEWINKCLNDTEEWVSELEDKGVEITGVEQGKKKKGWGEMRTILETSETIPSALIFTL